MWGGARMRGKGARGEARGRGRGQVLRICASRQGGRHGRGWEGASGTGLGAFALDPGYAFTS